MKYLRIFVCLLLGGLFLGPFLAEAITTTEGSDGTAGVRDNAQLDEATGRVFCSQSARGPSIAFPKGTGTFNNCSSSTVSVTDICTTTPESGGCPAAGTDSKIDVGWLPSSVLTSSGTSGYVPKWTGASSLGNSILFDSGSGLGINTAAPGAQLEVYDSSPNGFGIKIQNVGSPSQFPYFAITQMGSYGYGLNNWANAGVIEGQASGGMVFGAYAGPITFQTGGRLPRMTVTTDGRIGIGTAEPSAKLGVVGEIASTNKVACTGCLWALGTVTATVTDILSGTKTATLSVTAGNNTLYAIAPAAFAIGAQYTDTQTTYATGTGSGSNTHSYSMNGTRTNTYPGNNGFTYTVSGTNTFTTTQTSSGTVNASAPATVTLTSGAAERSYTYTGTDSNTVTVTNTASVTDFGAGTGTISGTNTSTVVAVGGTNTYSETITATATVIYPVAGTWGVAKTTTGSGTFTSTKSITFSGLGTNTLTTTHTKSSIATETLTHTATGTASGSWTYTQSNVASTNSALVSSNPTVVLNGTLTSTVLGTHTHTSVAIYGNFPVAQITDAIAEGDSRLTDARNSINTLQVIGGHFITGTNTDTDTRVWDSLSSNTTMVITNASTGVVVLPNTTKTLTGTQTITQTDLATATPTAGKIPIADGSGLVNGWVSGRVLGVYAASNASSVSLTTQTRVDVATVTYSASGNVMVWGNGRISGGNAGGICALVIEIDGSDYGPSDFGATTPHDSELTVVSIVGAAFGLSAGSHTVKLRMAATPGQTCSITNGKGYVMVQVSGVP